MDGVRHRYWALPVVLLAEPQQGWGLREDRAKDAWQAVCGRAGVSPPAPYAMVGSGHELIAGVQFSASVYREMVDRELARPAGALVHAHRHTLSTSEMTVTVQVTNLTSVTLSSQANAAVVSVWSYDPFAELGYSVHQEQPIAEPLAPGSSARYELRAPPRRKAYLAVVEYRPGGDAGRWDMLQAAIVRSAELPPMPSPVPPTATPSPLPPTPVPVTPRDTTAPSPTVTRPAGLYLPGILKHAPWNWRAMGLGNT